MFPQILSYLIFVIKMIWYDNDSPYQDKYLSYFLVRTGMVRSNNASLVRVKCLKFYISPLFTKNGVWHFLPQPIIPNLHSCQWLDSQACGCGELWPSLLFFPSSYHFNFFTCFIYWSRNIWFLHIFCLGTKKSLITPTW